ncbi:hypothetical protein FA95DRAFT_1553462 [Auriscalpium vulgare]|uniref:Uncharacterized protein n=1 Tax=Auriscalpium vulgare TaxID=40419 RepID=A0ACB8S7T6_9AGAM|nr:hypothetical protein FA95DRAFT_1553462 [Auriscalpium vulgare]
MRYPHICTHTTTEHKRKCVRCPRSSIPLSLSKLLPTVQLCPHDTSQHDLNHLPLVFVH